MRSRLLFPLLGLLTILSGGIPATPQALAQQAAAPAAAPALSDEKLHAFIVAALKVGDLIDEWSPKIEAAKTPEEQDKLKQQANSELVAAIQGNGDLTLPEYQAISTAAENDPALQERILNILQQGGPQKQQ